MSKIKFILAMVALLAAGFISFKLIPYANEIDNQVVLVLVATDEILAYQEINGTNTQTKEMRKKDLPLDYLQSLNEDELYAENYIYPGDIITESKVLKDKLVQSELFDKDTVIVSIKFNGLAEGVAGKIRSGDIVAATCYSRASNELVLEDLLKELEVLDLVDRNGRSIIDPKKEFFSVVDSRNILPEAIVIKCTIEQALRLIELDKLGQLHFILIDRT